MSDVILSGFTFVNVAALKNAFQSVAVEVGGAGFTVTTKVDSITFFGTRDRILNIARGVHNDWDSLMGGSLENQQLVEFSMKSMPDQMIKIDMELVRDLNVSGVLL